MSDLLKTASEPYVCSEPRNYHEGLQPSLSHFSRQDMPFGQFLKARGMVPNHVARVTPDGKLTFSELDELIRQYASALLAVGVRPGEAIGSF